MAAVFRVESLVPDIEPVLSSTRATSSRSMALRTSAPAVTLLCSKKPADTAMGVISAEPTTLGPSSTKLEVIRAEPGKDDRLACSARWPISLISFWVWAEERAA